MPTLRGTLDITLPTAMAQDSARFIKAMRAVEGDIRALDVPSAIEQLMKATPADQRVPKVGDAISSMCNQLVELERKGWNGIWARILSNYFATACLPKFSCVIGNPPWIDWKNLPEKYRGEIKSLCVDRGLFSGAGRTGGINLNICALITNVTSLNWLSAGGVLSFLMPKELSYQASYEGWRVTGPGPGKSIIEFHDWSDAGHPFDPVKEDFMTFVIGSSHGPSTEAPVFHYQKLRGVQTPAKLWKSGSEANASLNVTRRFAKAIIPNSTAFTIANTVKELDEMALVAGECSYIGREGVEFYPQELFLFQYIGPGPKPGSVYVENIQVAKSKHRVPRRRRLLESEFLFPLVKGPNIESFCLVDGLLLVPFPYDAIDPLRPLDEPILRRRAKLLFEYYREHAEIIRAQTKFSDKIRGDNPGAYYGLARTGPYSFQNTYVAFRDNSKWCACVVGKMPMPWGEKKRMVFQNHAVSICERANKKGYITQDEAHYVCAILNAPLVERLVLQSSDNRSFKIRPPIYLPPYDKHNPLHAELSRLSRLAHSDPRNVQEVRTKIDSVYRMLCINRAKIL